MFYPKTGFLTMRLILYENKIELDKMCVCSWFENLTRLIDFMLYIHSKQPRSCKDGQLSYSPYTILGNCLFAFHLVLKHLLQNVILPSFCIPKDVKKATQILKTG